MKAAEIIATTNEKMDEVHRDFFNFVKHTLRMQESKEWKFDVIASAFQRQFNKIEKMLEEAENQIID